MHYHEDVGVDIFGGEAGAKVGDDRFKVRTGDFIEYRQGNLSHKLVNKGNCVLRCIVVGQGLIMMWATIPGVQGIYRQQGMLWNVVDIENISGPTAAKKT